MKDRRIGKFRISINMIETNPELVKRIMGECIILEAEMKYIDESIHYTAISKWFNRTLLGEEAMTYSFKFVGNKWMFTLE